MNLIEERGHGDALGPLLRDPSVKPDAGAQAQQQVEIIEAVADTRHFEATLGYMARGDRLTPDEAPDAW